jgi:hypothetical protein
MAVEILTALYNPTTHQSRNSRITCEPLNTTPIIETPTTPECTASIAAGAQISLTPAQLRSSSAPPLLTADKCKSTMTEFSTQRAWISPLSDVETPPLILPSFLCHRKLSLFSLIHDLFEEAQLKNSIQYITLSKWSKQVRTFLLYTVHELCCCDLHAGLVLLEE